MLKMINKIPSFAVARRYLLLKTSIYPFSNEINFDMLKTQFVKEKDMLIFKEVIKTSNNPISFSVLASSTLQ